MALPLLSQDRKRPFRDEQDQQCKRKKPNPVLESDCDQFQHNRGLQPSDQQSLDYPSIEIQPSNISILDSRRSREFEHLVEQRKVLNGQQVRDKAKKQIKKIFPNITEPFIVSRLDNWELTLLSCTTVITDGDPLNAESWSKSEQIDFCREFSQFEHGSYRKKDIIDKWKILVKVIFPSQFFSKKLI
jgi:hypothetical protein